MVLFGKSRRARPADVRMGAETEALAARVLEKRRGRKPIQPLPSMARHIGPLLKPLLEKAGTGIHELRRSWPEIVGEKLAKATEPEKISGGVLTIKAPGAVAPFVQHQAALILERCRLAGAKVKTLTIKQGAPAALGRAANVRTLKPAAAEPEVEGLEGVAAPRLRAALSRLGRAVGRG